MVCNGGMKLALATLVLAASLAASGALWVPSAQAKLGFGGGCGGGFCAFDSPGTLSSDGRTVRITGHVTCDPLVEGWKLHLSLTQESTTAGARSVVTNDCKEGPIPFSAEVVVPPSAPAFERGKALACGMLLTGEGANIQHAGFWCRYIEVRTN